MVSPSYLKFIPQNWFNSSIRDKLTQFEQRAMEITGIALYHIGRLILVIGAVHVIGVLIRTFSITELNKSSAIPELLTGAILSGVGRKLKDNVDVVEDPLSLWAWGLKAFIHMIRE